MNELLASLAASLQALLLLASAQGVVVPTQSASVLHSLQKTEVHEVRKPKQEINTHYKDATVNILCTTRSGGTFNPISGSGVIIDKRGIILTNAHVAQYVLLENHYSRNSIHCVVRTGAPARAKFTAEIILLPNQWARKHAKDIRKASPLGTGEHDYALLAITKHIDGRPINDTKFTSAKFNFSEPVTMPGERIFLSGYPAGFLGGAMIQRNLWPVSTIGQIRKLLTFKTGSIDIYGLGGSIIAQSGSSGGAVADKNGNLIGIITTSTTAYSTDKRDLRALTLKYINRDLQYSRGVGLRQFLAQDISSAIKHFATEQAPEIIKYYKQALE